MHIDPMVIAGNYALLVEKDKAFAWLEKAYTEGNIWLLYLKGYPQLISCDPIPGTRICFAE